jgi:hypothetical protein
MTKQVWVIVDIWRDDEGAVGQLGWFSDVARETGSGLIGVGEPALGRCDS